MVPGGAGYNTALADGVDVILGGGCATSCPRAPAAAAPTAATWWPK
jgi:hypothetical protein